MFSVGDFVLIRRHGSIYQGTSTRVTSVGKVGQFADDPQSYLVEVIIERAHDDRPERRMYFRNDELLAMPQVDPAQDRQHAGAEKEEKGSAMTNKNGIEGLVSVARRTIRDADAFIDTTSSMQQSTENALVAIGLLLDIVTKQQEDIQRLTRLLDAQQHPRRIKIIGSH